MSGHRVRSCAPQARSTPLARTSRSRPTAALPVEAGAAVSLAAMTLRVRSSQEQVDHRGRGGAPPIAGRVEMPEAPSIVSVRQRFRLSTVAFTEPGWDRNQRDGRHVAVPARCDRCADVCLRRLGIKFIEQGHGDEIAYHAL